MSARAQNAAPQGETPRKQNTKRTVPGLMAGIGASGAVLAGAIVSFVVLVGAVSFDAWPESSPTPTAESGELFSAPTEALAKPAKTEVADTRPDRRDPTPAPSGSAEPSPSPAPSGGGSNGGGDGGSQGGGDKPANPNPKPSTGTSQSGGTGSSGGSTGVADGGGAPSPPAGGEGGSSRPDQSGPRGDSGGRGD